MGIVTIIKKLYQVIESYKKYLQIKRLYKYDALGNASSFVYNGNRYIYVRNGTNDIVGILDSTGTLVTTYKYDGWGNVEVVNHTTDTIGNINPLRYRSYYYDVETGYYYLNSRYYDSNVGRFINSDSISNLGANEDYNSLNLYAYCANNPINRLDSNGDMWCTPFIKAATSMLSTFLQGLITGEKPTIRDYLFSAVSGFLSAFGVYERFFSGMIAFGYAVSSAHENDASLFAALLSGIVSFSLCYFDLDEYLNQNMSFDKVSKMIINIVYDSATLIFEAGVGTGVNNYSSSHSNKNESKKVVIQPNYQQNRQSVVQSKIFRPLFEARYM